MFIYDFFKKCFDRGPQCGLYGVIHKQSYRLQFTFLEEFLSWCWTTECALECRECGAAISTQYTVRDTVRREREGERGVTWFVFMAQLVFCWSSLLAPGRPMFILLISIKCSPTILSNDFQQGSPPFPLSNLKNLFHAFSKSELDQSENIIERFESAWESYTKKWFRQFQNQIERWNGDFPLDPSRFLQLHNIVQSV